MNHFSQIIINAATTVLTQTLNFFPNLLGAVIVFFIGVVVSKWAKALTIKFIKAIKIDTFLKSVGVKKFLKANKISLSIDEILGQAVRLIVLLVFVASSTNLLGLVSVSDALNKLLSFVPSILSAILILSFGILLAGVLENAVKAAATHINGQAARMLGKITSYTVMVFAVLAAISELNIARDFIHIVFTGFIATLSLGLGLAFGLGSKDTVAKMLDSWYQKKK